MINSSKLKSKLIFFGIILLFRKWDFAIKLLKCITLIHCVLQNSVHNLAQHLTDWGGKNQSTDELWTVEDFQGTDISPC